MGYSVYLAARYSRNAEMRDIRDLLETNGIKVTSRWIDCHGKLEASFTPERPNAEPRFCGEYGQTDINDLLAADAVVSFTSLDGGGKGGRHVEFGLGLALPGKRSIIVGPRENVFHYLPQVDVVADVDELLSLLLIGRV